VIRRHPSRRRSAPQTSPRFLDFNCNDHAGAMWQGGLAAGKPSVPWYQIHVRGTPGWRACRRPQARPSRFVLGNNGERSLGPAAGEAAPCNAAYVGPPPTVNADHRPGASTRRPARAVRVGDASVAGRFCRTSGLGPRGHAMLRQMSEECGGTAPKRIRRANQPPWHFAAGPPAALTAL
jgi:hypothetical protein